MTMDVVKTNGHAQLMYDATQQEYTFPSSGITVTVHKVSQQRLTDHRNAMRRMDEAKGIVPRPPVQQIDIAGEMVSQPNFADPDYLLALNEYENAAASKELDWFISKVLVVDTARVAEYRAKSLAEDGTDYAEASDAYLYLWHIVCLNTREYQEFYSVASSLSAPTPAAIADAKSRF